jgi:tetrahydromethanopterin S-methyltransferase subunit G
MMLQGTTDHEKQSLEAHVDLCAIRYQNLDNRLTKVEEKLEVLHEDVRDNKSQTMKAVIGAVVTIIVALIGAVATILSSMPG